MLQLSKERNVMKISEVNIVPVKPHNGLVAFASLVINDDIFVGSIAIHEKLSGGFRLTYPTKQSGLHKSNVFHPINRDAGAVIEKAVMNKLNDVMKKANNHVGYNSPIDC